MVFLKCKGGVIVTEKNNFFSYGYEQNGDAWELKYDDFIIQIVQTTDNFKDLSDFRKGGNSNWIENNIPKSKLRNQPLHTLWKAFFSSTNQVVS